MVLSGSMVLSGLSSPIPCWEGTDDSGAAAPGGFGAGIGDGDSASGKSDASGGDEAGSGDATKKKPARKRRVRKKPVRRKAPSDAAEDPSDDPAENPSGDASAGDQVEPRAGDDGPASSDEPDAGGDERGGRKRRRRGSRGGRRRKRGEDEETLEVDTIPGEDDDLDGEGEGGERAAAPKKKRTRRRSRSKAREDSEAGDPEAGDAEAGDPEAGAPASGATEGEEAAGAEEGTRKKRRRRRSRKKAASAGDEEDAPKDSSEDTSEDGGEGDDRPAKKTRRKRSKKAGGTAAKATKTAEEKAAEAEALRTQTIAVNAVEPEERRVAVYEGGRIEDILMTAESQKTLVNDIYRGRVVNLEPAIGAAFIDFGQGRNGFLHTSDVLPIYADDDFQLEDLLTGGHHDEEGDHDADWSEEADALDEDHDDEDEVEEVDAPADDSADDGGEAPSADASPEGGDSEDGDTEDDPAEGEATEGEPAGDGGAPGFASGIEDEDDDPEEPKGTRSLRSRSRRPASSRVAAVDDGEPAGSDGDKPARKKRKRRSSKKKASGGSEGGDAEVEAKGDEPPASGGRKRSSSRKRSRKKAASADADAEGGAKAKSAKKKTKKKAERKSKKKASSRRKASKGGSKSGGGRSRGRSERRPQRERRPIDQLLKVGDPVVVQVTKDAIGDKGPTLTTYISMPGRYLVLMPSMSRTGVSRKIPDDKERKRLKRILASLKTPADMGVIVRTAGVGRTKADLQRDLDYLLGLWESFGKKLKSSRGPAPLYLESDVATRTLRDLFNRRTKEVLVDDFTVYEQMVSFAEKLMPEHVGRIKRYEGDRPLFQESGLEQEFERIFSRRVDLPSGGSIVFDQAEALVAIDVNSGRTRTDSYDFEDIALKTNLEAVPEIARQIKLRDLGGIIVCDFIDMMRSSSNRQVERALRDALADDRARSKLGRISQFGLLEMTRQRLGPGTHKKVFQACPRCRGTGRIRTVESRAQAILRRLGGAMVQKGFTKVEVRAHPEVVQYLKEDLWDWVRALEHRSEKQIELTSVPDQVEDSVLRYLRADGREVRPGGRRKR